MKKKSYITFTDQFCGAGGSSQGVRALAHELGGGLEVKMALNHWRLAIETHNTNFPDTLHDCTDISACDPRRYPSTDFLLTSPECTTHSPAGGNTHKALKKQIDMFDAGVIDPATERSRATMWDVCRFAEYHKYNFIILENVVEAKTRWALFDTWLTAMHVLGYNHKCVYLNSMHFHPTPQSRDRMYIVFWKKGNPAPDLEYKPLAFCPKCAGNVNAIQTWKNKQKTYGKYRFQYVYCCPSCSTVVEPYYYAAFNIIDWADKGTRIGSRKKPLADKTIVRIEGGRKKFGNQRLMVVNYSPGGSKPLHNATSTITGADHHGLFTPFFIKGEHSQQEPMLRAASDVLQTQATRQTMSVVVPAPFIIDGNFDAKPSRAIAVDDPLPVQNTQNRGSVFFGHIVEANKTGECKPASSALSTITSGGINHAMVYEPLIVENKGQSTARTTTEALACVTGTSYQGLLTNDSWNSFIASYYGGSNCISHVTDELGTISTKERHLLINDYQQPSLEDCYYRMLKPGEIKLGMAFEPTYVILGSGRDQVKQCGNAVNPPPMKWLIGQCVKTLW